MSVETQILGVGPWVVVTAAITWFGQMQLHRVNQRKIDHDAHIAERQSDVDIEKTRGDLTLQLLSSARSEAVAARAEIEGLHAQMASLRSLEQHFFHFQQALDHLDAILMAEDGAARESAERVARAFLTRMRRLMDAKGTIANEVQRVDSTLNETEKTIRDKGGAL